MIGMAGIMSGVMRAPMTGALFAAELTNHLSALPETIAAGVGRLCDQRADHEALDPDRKDRAARTPHPSRIFGRRARVPAGGPGDDARSEDACPATCRSPTRSRFFAEEAEHRSYPVVDERRAAARAGLAHGRAAMAGRAARRRPARRMAVRCLDRCRVPRNAVRRSRRHDGGIGRRPSADRRSA